MGKNKSSKEHNPDTSTNVPQREKIKNDIKIRTRSDLTPKQKQLIDLILDKGTQILFLNGPAGVSKTYIAVYTALLALNKKTQSDVLYIRSAIESASKSLGALPGTALEKIDPYLMPLMDKLEELISKHEIDILIKEGRITGNVVNYVRGSSWNAKFIVVDEAQNLNAAELKTLITRLGKHSKLLFLADPGQSDIGKTSGFQLFYNLFNDQESKEKGIHCFSFDKSDIVRNEILGYILDKIEGTYVGPKTN